MRMQPKKLLAAALVLILAASPGVARNGGNGHHYGWGVPGPIAGAGLGYLALLSGGYYLYRRWRRRNTEE